MECKIAVIRGDGIGPEVIDAAVGCLDAVAGRFGHKFVYSHPLLGGAAVDQTGVPLPQETIDECTKCGAVLLGPVGGPKWENLAWHLRPEKGVLALRSALGLYANVRPVLLYDSLKADSPLKPSLTKKGVNLVFVRDQTGGIYYGQRGYRDGKNGQEAYDTEVYSIAEVERIADLAFTVAMGRRKKVTSIDKADVLESSKLWRATVTKIAQNYPEVELKHMLVSSAAAGLTKDPSAFDVVLCPAMFGEILSNIAGTLTGSHALIPSSSLGATKLGLYEPIHSSAYDIAGTDAANPIGAILSVAMMLSSSFNLPQETAAVEKAINTVLSKGYRTADLAESGNKIVSCSKMGELIATEILNG